MSMTPTSEPKRRGLDRRTVALAIAVVIVLAAIAAVVVVYVVFFASEAPPAPTLDDALKVLLPSPSP